jgi:four helix bundle protein
MTNFRKLEVWRLAHETTLEVYRVTATLPSHERYGLVSQMRRSAVSMAANIAEGAGRDTDQDFARFITIARSSANETDYHALLAKDLGYIDESTWARVSDLIGRTRAMLNRLRQTLLNS